MGASEACPIKQRKLLEAEFASNCMLFLRHSLLSGGIHSQAGQVERGVVTARPQDAGQKSGALLAIVSFSRPNFRSLAATLTVARPGPRSQGASGDVAAGKRKASSVPMSWRTRRSAGGHSGGNGRGGGTGYRHRVKGRSGGAHACTGNGRRRVREGTVPIRFGRKLNFPSTRGAVVRDSAAWAQKLVLTGMERGHSKMIFSRCID